MFDPISMHNDIARGILQSFTMTFPSFPGQVAPVTGTDNAQSTDSVRRAEENESSFSQALAQRLADASNLEEEEVRRIINEEIASAVENNSSELVALLTGISNINTSDVLSLFNRNGLGGTNFSALSGFSSLSDGNMPFSFGSSALLGLADPFDSLQMYASLLNLQRTNTA